jgi:hypothetical protein
MKGAHFVVDASRLPADPCDPDLGKLGKKKNIAGTEVTQAKRLMTQLKLASLWKYNYEEWLVFTPHSSLLSAFSIFTSNLPTSLLLLPEVNQV